MWFLRSIYSALTCCPSQLNLVMSCLGFLKQFDVSLLAFKWANWVSCMLAVQICWLSTWDAPSKFSWWDTLFINHRRACVFSFHWSCLWSITPLARLWRSGDCEERHLSLLLIALGDQSLDLTFIVTRTLNLLNEVLSDVFLLRRMDAHVVDQIGKSNMSILLLRSECN